LISIKTPKPSEQEEYRPGKGWIVEMELHHGMGEETHDSQVN
jgi:hypothetical protein